ncbi:MAG: hypothetical protein AAF533_07300 [Acidobacteriota bacterium]
MKIIQSARDYCDQFFLRRSYAQPTVKGTNLELRVDLSRPEMQARAEADFRFRPLQDTKTVILGIGPVTVRSATWKGHALKTRCNSPFVILRFPEKLENCIETRIHLKYSYWPDSYGTLRQPLTKNDFPTKVWLTCRRPLLALCQGELIESKEEPPLRVFEWAPPRSRRLNAVVATVRSFRKQADDELNLWLHVRENTVDIVPRILDLMLEIYEECRGAHGKGLPYEHLHVVESDEADREPFNSPGLIVVPRGSLINDRPKVYGLLAPEFNKEWGREAIRLQHWGEKD